MDNPPPSYEFPNKESFPRFEREKEKEVGFPLYSPELWAHGDESLKKL